MNRASSTSAIHVLVTSLTQFESNVPTLFASQKMEWTYVHRAFVLERNLGSIKEDTRIASLYVVTLHTALGEHLTRVAFRQSTGNQLVSNFHGRLGG